MSEANSIKKKSKSSNIDSNTMDANNGSNNDDEKEKKRKKQIKRMGKLLSTIWDLSDPIFQDGSSNSTSDKNTTTTTTALTNVGEKLDDKTSVYYTKIGKHGWIHFAQDITHVYIQHIHSKTKYASIAKKHIQSIKDLFRDIHADLEGTINEYCNNYTNSNNTSSSSSNGHAGVSSQVAGASSSSLTTPNRNHHDLSAASSSEYADKEAKYMEALHTYIHDLVSTSSNNKSGNHNVDKMTKRLLDGFHCRVVKNSSRYDVSYYNTKLQHRKFRSRIEIARHLNLIHDSNNSDDENGDDNYNGDDYHNKKKKRSAASQQAQQQSSSTFDKTAGNATSSYHNTTPSSSSSLKRRRTIKTSTKQQDAEKKKIRQEIDKLRKAHHRATKALDDYYMTQQNSQNNIHQSNTIASSPAAVSSSTTIAMNHHQMNEYPIDDRLLLLLQNNEGDSTSKDDTMMNGCDNKFPSHTDLALRRIPDRVSFPNVPIHCTPEVIMTWDFLCTFHRALSLSPIELDDFVHTLTYVPPTNGQLTGDDIVSPPVYIAEAHLALLKLLLQDKSSDEWWWSILETETLEGIQNEASIGDNNEEAENGNTDDVRRPVIRIDIAAALSEVEDPLITNSWLSTLEKVLNDKNIAVKRKVKVTNAIRTCLKYVSNKWISAYLRKSLIVLKVNGPIETLQAIRWLVFHVRAARPDLGERGVQQSTVRQAREKVILDVVKQMESLGTSAPEVAEGDLTIDDGDESEDDESDDDDDDMDTIQNGKKGNNTGSDDTERPASIIPPKPLPTLVDLLLPPNKPQYNDEFVDAFSWSHLAAAAVVRILHRKKRLLNESDDAIRAAHALPPPTVAERREREKLASSRILTEVENNSDEPVSEKAALHLCNGGNYLDLSVQERLSILRILIEASYDSGRVHDVVSGNYKQRTSAMKALDVEQRRAKREAKEKVSKDESAARQRLAADVRQRFLNEQREEIRKLNDKSKEFSDDVIESLTDEDIIDFDDDIKADYEALPGPETFTKIEVNQMISKLQEEEAFETHDLRVCTLSELEERESRELEELEGRYAGFGGDAALTDTSLDRDTMRTLQGLRREVERARTLAESLPDQRSKALAQLKDALEDGRIKVLRTAYNVAKKARLVGSDDETGGVWALDLMRDAALELEKAKQNKRVLDAQKDLVAKRNKCFIRTEPMGRDRCGNRFWSFTRKGDDGDGEDGSVWVETEFRLQNEEDQTLNAKPELLNLIRNPDSVYFGASDKEEDFAQLSDQKSFLRFSRCEYHSSGFDARLALQHWGCHSTDESLRSLIKGLDSRGIRENDLKIKLKEILEETLGSGESEKPDLLVPKMNDETEPDFPEVDRIRYDGDEAVFIEAKDAVSNSGVDSNVDRDAFDDLYSGIGVSVRIRQVIDPNKDPPIARYENGKADAWKICISTKVQKESNTPDPDYESPGKTVIEVPSWRVASEGGRIIWISGEELLESLARYKKWNQGQGYFENDAAYFLYRNALGKYCGKNSEAAYAASPYYFAKVMLKKEAELYPKLKTRSVDNCWSGQNGARALWTNSMKDYAYDFQSVKQGLLTLENALFELTGSFNGYTNIDAETESIDVKALLLDPSSAFDIELESIEKNLPGLWNSPKVRAVFLYIIEQSKTTGFLSLALDLLCRNTMKYLQTHNLLNVRSSTSSDRHYNPSSEIQSSRTTRRMNAWQQQQEMYY